MATFDTSLAILFNEQRLSILPAASWLMFFNVDITDQMFPNRKCTRTRDCRERYNCYDIS